MKQQESAEGDGMFIVTTRDSSSSAFAPTTSTSIFPSASTSSSQQQQHDHQRPTRSSKKRRRIIIPAFSLSGNSASAASSSFQNDKDPLHDDRPDLVAFSQLLSALLLTTGLGLLSALDAKEQCLQHETYALLDLVDDDNFQKAYEQASMGTANCILMFHNIAATGGITFGLGSLGLGILYCYNRGRRKQPQFFNPTTTMRVTTALLLLCTGILAAQTYNIIAVMLKPRRDNNEGTEYENEAEEAYGGADDSASSNSNNPYQSLAAVDRYGHVGDNANLYYLSWLSEGLALALVYQLFTATVRLIRAASVYNEANATPLIHDASRPEQELYLLPTASWDDYYHTLHARNRQNYLKNRAHWFQNLYKLRARAGIWAAALFSCLVLVAASLATWNQVIWPYTKESPSSQSIKYLHVCQHIADNVSASGYNSSSDSTASVPLCRRTVGAWLSGVIATALCATAIAMHLAARQSALTRHFSILNLGLSPTWHSNSGGNETATSPIHHGRASSWEQIMLQNKIPLQTELVLSFLLSCLLGFNAVFATGVQGPASTVGNLYYASWASFLLCLRICLGCVEEYHNIQDDEKESDVDDVDNAGGPQSNATKTATGMQRSASYQPPNTTTDSTGGSQATRSCATNNSEQTSNDPLEKNRVKRLRGYCCLWIFSVVCACSAYDAAANQQKKLTAIQRYMIIAPVVVAAISACLFLLCLSKRCYQIVSTFWIGGVLSIVCFGFWFVDLVLTMHSEDSWAVNGIGEIEVANLYYFSWGAIITAGIQMMYYVKALFGIHYQDNMVIVWMSICKVCFVILGASLHIWHTIGSNCEFDEIALGAVTYCSRTVLSLIFALTGMAVGGLVVFGRLCVHICCRFRCTRIQAHAEMLISLFLVLLFGAAVALITGIGGPGQSVGDLYYSTWIAFWVSLGIFVTCYNQLQDEEGEEQQQADAKQCGGCELNRRGSGSFDSGCGKITEQAMYTSVRHHGNSVLV